ncbi:hypothetical protein [Rhizobium sp. GCM10022189]|uniref:hypothetical protein n=1 Tax=Rhizobium sp. GCM10022189 TaxID=3252654 RepID=UPI00360B9EE4
MTTALDSSCIDHSRANRILQTRAVENESKVVGENDDETITFYQSLGQDLLDADAKGLIELEASVVRPQIENMRLLGRGDKPAVTRQIGAILRVLLNGAELRGGSKDIAIISLYRPGDKGGPHLAGRAIDIGRFAGKRLNSAFPDEAAEGVTACYRDLAQNAKSLGFKFALGLPRNLRTDNPGIEAELKGNGWEARAAIYSAALGQGKRINFFNQSSEETQKIYDAIRVAYKFTDVFFSHNNVPGKSPTGLVKSDIEAFVRTAVRDEWLQILNSGGKGLSYLFPDAADHLHIQLV